MKSLILQLILSMFIRAIADSAKQLPVANQRTNYDSASTTRNLESNLPV